MATVKIKYRDKEYEVNAGMTVRDAIRKVGLQPEAVLAVSDGKLITDDTIIEPSMKIKLVAVVSGGAARPPLRVGTGDARSTPAGEVGTSAASATAFSVAAGDALNTAEGGVA